MDVAGVWEVDRLATAELLASLQTAPQTEWPDLVAQAFARTRLKNYEWAANRVRDSVICILEEKAVDEFKRKDTTWTDGFRHAEECLVALTPSELLKIYYGSPKSKGQVLRSFVRYARKNSDSIY